MRLLVALAIIAAAVSADYTNYDGYKVYQAIPTTERHAEVLKIFKESGEYDFWSNGRLLGQPASVMVKPELQDTFTKTLDADNVKYSILIENVEKVFQKERDRQARAPKIEEGRISFTQYHRYEEIQAYLERLSIEYPNLANVSYIGTSWEGRALSHIQVGNNPDNPTILIDGAIHGHEWIAPPVALYIIQQLVENEAFSYLSENANWLIVPVINPDGYEYTHTDDRMWHQTRSIRTACYGVDANLNFGYKWGGLGASDIECNDNYCGPRAFSESEVARLRDLVSRHEKVDLYIALHSYGNWLLYPWGYDAILPDNANEVHHVGELMAEAIRKVFGTTYSVASAGSVHYPAAGGAGDYMMAYGGADLSFTLELPGGGDEGFDLPADRIRDVVIETWPGILAAYEYVVNNQKK